MSPVVRTVDHDGECIPGTRRQSVRSGERVGGRGPELGRRVGRLAVAADAERSDPPSDDREPDQRAESLGKEQQDEQEP
jgi:hypothetical protein